MEQLLKLVMDQLVQGLCSSTRSGPIMEVQTVRMSLQPLSVIQEDPLVKMLELRGVR